MELVDKVDAPEPERKISVTAILTIDGDNTVIAVVDLNSIGKLPTSELAEVLTVYSEHVARQLTVLPKKTIFAVS